jgi:hypothetical protein
LLSVKQKKSMARGFDTHIGADLFSIYLWVSEHPRRQ